MESGSLIESVLSTNSIGSPHKIFLTGISILFPVIVIGIASTVYTSSGECLGDTSLVIADQLYFQKCFQHNLTLSP